MNKFHFTVGDILYFCNFDKKTLLAVYTNGNRDFFNLEGICFGENFFYANAGDNIFDFDDDECHFQVHKGWKCSNEKI